MVRITRHEVECQEASDGALVLLAWVGTGIWSWLVEHHPELEEVKRIWCFWRGAKVDIEAKKVEVNAGEGLLILLPERRPKPNLLGSASKFRSFDVKRSSDLHGNVDMYKQNVRVKCDTN